MTMQNALHNRDKPGCYLNVQHRSGITAGRGVPQLDISGVPGIIIPIRQAKCLLSQAPGEAVLEESERQLADGLVLRAAEFCAPALR